MKNADASNVGLELSSQTAEHVYSELHLKWISPSRIEKGEALLFAHLKSELAARFAAIHLIVEDMVHCINCFQEADKLGLPDAANTISKALIHAGVVSYARSFKTGVRPLRFTPEELGAMIGLFDVAIHEYLVAIRDKHVAHSVNEFESSHSFAVLVGSNEGTIRDGSGIGVVIQNQIGLPRHMLLRAITHVTTLKNCLAIEIENLRIGLYTEFKEEFRTGKSFEMAPIMKMADRANVAKRRGG